MQIRNTTITDASGTHNVLEVSGGIDGVLSTSLNGMLTWGNVTGIDFSFTIKMKADVATSATVNILGNSNIIEVGTEFATHRIDVGGWSNASLSIEFETDEPVYIEEWSISGQYITSTYSGDPDDPESEYIITNTAHSYSGAGSISAEWYQVDSGIDDPDELGSISSTERGISLATDREVAVIGSTSEIGNMKLVDDDGAGTVYESHPIRSGVLSPVTVYSTYIPYSMDVQAYLDGVLVTPAYIGTTQDGELEVRVPLPHSPARGDEIVSIAYRTAAVHAKSFTFGNRRAGRSEGSLSTAIGDDVVADGVGAFAEGKSAEASGRYSRALGRGVKTIHENETVLGSYNANTVEDMLLVVGNGSSDESRSNAMTLAWDGTLRSKNIDAGWIQVSITKASAVSTATNLEAYKHNGLMHVAFTVRATIPAGSWTTIATIASGTKYRPASDTYTYGGVTSRPIGIRVTTGGAVQVYTSTAISDNLLYGSIQYPASADIINGSF